MEAIMNTEKQLLRELRHSGILIEQLRAANARLTAEIEELREGKCRYNCSTAKENWIAGYNHTDDGSATVEEAWNEYRASS